MLDPTLTDKAKNYDLLSLAERYTTLKRAASTGGGEYHGACPFCPASKDSFSLQLNHKGKGQRWYCRKCSGGYWLTVIDFQMRLAGQNFKEAVIALAGDQLPAPTRRVIPAEDTTQSEPPTQDWQDRAREVIAICESNLWSDHGEPARQWLRERGLNDDTLRRWHVGYLPGHYKEWRKIAGHSVPCGVVIPCEVNGAIWYVKTRRATGNPKFQQIKGGRVALFMGDTLINACEACVTEGEFDAMLLWQCLQHATNERWRSLGVATPGSKENHKHLDLDIWARYLIHLRRLVIMYDQDGESEEAKDYWRSIAGRAYVHRWSNINEGDKDLTDFHKSGGRLLDLASFGVTLAEYHDPDPIELPEVITSYIADAGLQIAECEPDSEGFLITVTH
jgi:hypothetical protein